MKRILTLVLLPILLSCTVSSFSQTVQSGSLQITYRGEDYIRIELEGPLYFNESFYHNFIFAGLIPGEYELRIYIGPAPRGGRDIAMVNERISIHSQRRTVINLQTDTRFTVQQKTDRNTVPICFGNDRYPRQPERRPIVVVPELIRADDFDRLMSTLKKMPFDHDKFEILKVSSKNNSLYTKQIADIMKLFAFDDGKLMCASILCPKAYDPQNAYTLGDLFSFPSTRNQFYELLKSR